MKTRDNLFGGDADEAAGFVVGDGPEGAVGGLFDVAEALALVEEEAFFGEDFVSAGGI